MDMHGLSSGLNSVLESGNFKGFGVAAASGFVSSAISSGIEALGQTDGGFVDGKTGKSIASYNNFGKSDWFKATIIVSGGVSGGISSRIAGGSFMDGFKQGLITAGLNHVASMGLLELQETKERRNIFGFLKEKGVDPLANPTDQNLEKIVEIFKDYYKLGDDLWVKFANESVIKEWANESYDYGSFVDKGGTIENVLGGKAYGVTHPINGRIILAPIMKSWQNYDLAYVVIHEMKHYSNWASNVFQGVGIAHDFDEMSAYLEAASWGNAINSAGQMHIRNAINFLIMSRL